MYLTRQNLHRQSRYNNQPKPKSSKLSASEAEGVSIIRPLKGVDLELEANLISSFIQNYPKFEIIFSVASEKDPAIKIVEKLRREYHHVDSRLIIGMKKEFHMMMSCVTKASIV